MTTGSDARTEVIDEFYEEKEPRGRVAEFAIA